MTQNEWSKIIVAIAKAVKEVRELLGWSQQELADKAVVSQGAISRIEAGKHDGLPLHSIVVVFRALAVGASTVDIIPSPATRHLLAFVTSLSDDFTITEPIDQNLTALVRMFSQLNPEAQKSLVGFLAATGHDPALVTM